MIIHHALHVSNGDGGNMFRALQLVVLALFGAVFLSTFLVSFFTFQAYSAYSHTRGAVLTGSHWLYNVVALKIGRYLYQPTLIISPTQIMCTTRPQSVKLDTKQRSSHRVFATRWMLQLHYNDVIMGVMASHHQPHQCLLNRLFGRRSKKTSKLRVTGLCVGNSRTNGQ